MRSSSGEYAREARRLTDAVFTRFWNREARLFRAPIRSAETVDSDPKHDNGYLFWPTVLMFQALVDAERARKGTFGTRLAEVFGKTSSGGGMEQYYDREKSAYNAWLHFPGNNDKYYDDNGLAVPALVEAFESTRSAAYRDRARAIFDGFLVGGWDASGKPGGVRWGTATDKAPHTDRTASATATFALSALSLARVGIDRRRSIDRGRDALTWLWERLRDPADGLIRDGFRQEEGTGRWEMMPTKWTYNTGLTLRGYVDLYRLTKDKACLERARELAAAATDRKKGLYDGLVRAPEKRFWYDEAFFVHHLADGLLAFAEELRRAGEHREAENIRAEVRRNADYAMRYLSDPKDGLYFRNWRLWRISGAHQETWRKLTGQAHTFAPGDLHENERSLENSSLPIEKRPLVKTLLGNAGMARLFWLLARA